MSHKKIRRSALNAARDQTVENSITDLRTPPVTGGAPGSIGAPEGTGPDYKVPAPSRQKNARAFLEDKSPGIMQSYAPGAKASSVEGWVEDDETVNRLVDWRQEATY